MADVGMVQRRNCPGFALHALFEFGRRGKMGSKNFDRYRSIEADIAGAIHLAHAARSQRRLDLVRAKLGAGSQCHQCAELYPVSQEDHGSASKFGARMEISLSDHWAGIYRIKGAGGPGQLLKYRHYTH